ncbi:MAG: thiolase family protein [Candidatus Aminicenantes bacterium]|nr:thiolase family protein [Candidatus Aminicenantes bacterium]
MAKALAAIVGMGMIPCGKHGARSVIDMAAEAAYLALQDAGVKPGQVDACFYGNVLAGRLFGSNTIGQNVFWEVGINRAPVVNVENACTSGSTALYLGYNMIAAGQAEVVLAAASEKMYVKNTGLVDAGFDELDTLLGLVAPATFGIRARRYMKEFGATEKQLALVAVKNRSHARFNPLAQFREAITVEEVLASPMVADPLTRLQCCPIADGAAAVVLCSPAMAKRLGRAVNIEATVLVSGDYCNPPDLTRFETVRRAGHLAYEKAGIGPGDLHVVECHDAFTITEILNYEALGFCQLGEGGKLVEEGRTKLGGRLPVNVSGGLLSRGHPVGASGLVQAAEIVAQLRGEAGARQVQGARIGLVHNMGGDKDGDVRACTVSILSKI